MGLEGRVALVTGAARGIGLAIASDLVSRGMVVALVDLDEGVEQAAESLRRDGRAAHGIRADVTVKAQVEEMVERVERELGPLWLLVNCAAVLTAAPTVEMPEETWDRTFAVDAKGTFLCCQAAIGRMIPRGGGRIVNFSSIAGKIPRVAQIAYCSAKAAVNHFTRCLAVEMAPHGITVNAVLPGTTRTIMTLDSFSARGIDLDAVVGLVPGGRLATPEDHAAVVAFLASDEASFVTGQLVAVDGGQSDFMPLPRASVHT